MYGLISYMWPADSVIYCIQTVICCVDNNYVMFSDNYMPSLDSYIMSIYVNEAKHSYMCPRRITVYAVFK